MNKEERTRRREAALDRIQRSLDAIQRAQYELSRAAQELSPLQYGAAKNRAVVKEYDRVHTLWYRVKALASSLRVLLDHDPAERSR